MKLPTIIVNFKLYEQAVGQRALELAKIHEKVAKDTGASIAVAVNALDLLRVAETVEIPVFAQHFDPVEYGSYTGHIHPKVLKDAGVYGSLLNHAERQLPDNVLIEAIHQAKELGLYTVVCADTPEKGAAIAKCNPDLIAVEPPELIGGDISVSKAQADVVKDAVEMIGKGRTLVGAGIRDREDVQLSLEFGASGVLLASGITKAADPEAVLRDLVAGLSG